MLLGSDMHMHSMWVNLAINTHLREALAGMLSSLLDYLCIFRLPGPFLWTESWGVCYLTLTCPFCDYAW